MRYYVHGAGRTGKDAWPAQAPEATAAFCDHGSAQSAKDKADLVARQAPRAPYALIAHSLGAVAAVLAMRDHGLSPTHLILVEPALFDIARGSAAIAAVLARSGASRATLEGSHHRAQDHPGFEAAVLEFLSSNRH